MAKTGKIKSGHIQTVLGIIKPESLGYCQCHEHLFIAKGKPFEVNRALLMDDLSASTSELKLFKKSGGNSIVDAQPVGCGRMADSLVKASDRSGVNIIASTGFHRLIFYDDEHWLRKAEDSFLTELFISEIEEGMYIDADFELPQIRCGAKAGMVKVAVDSCGITGVYRKLFVAVADTAVKTGVPIMCHIEENADVMEAVDFFVNRGVRPDSIILCHLDRTKYNPEYHGEIADTGVYLEYDTIARFRYHSNEVEINLICKLLDKGYEDKILLGLDTTRERLRYYSGSIGLDYIRSTFIPLMLKYGISREAIHKMTVTNPKGALSIQ